MRRFAIVGAVIALAALCSAQTRFRRIHALGDFSNVRLVEGRASGYSVDLWRVDDAVEGLLVVTTGAKGDPPTAVLDGVKFNLRTGALSFKVKMITGCDVLRGLKLEPAYESFEFSGVLSEDILKGKMLRRAVDEVAPSQRVDEVELARRPDASILEAASYSEWRKKAEELSDAREPKCRGVLGEPKKKR